MPSAKPVFEFAPAPGRTTLGEPEKLVGGKIYLDEAPHAVKIATTRLSEDRPVPAASLLRQWPSLLCRSPRDTLQRIDPWRTLASRLNGVASPAWS